MLGAFSALILITMQLQDKGALYQLGHVTKIYAYIQDDLEHRAHQKLSRLSYDILQCV